MKISFFVLFRSSFNWLGFPGGSDGKASAWNAGDQGSIPGSGRSPGEGNGNPLQHSYLENPMDEGAWLIGYSPWGHKQSDTTERLHFYFPLSCIGEGNGNPLQCSCLENPMDGEAWWAAVYGVTQSRTRLKWLSSSSSTPFWKIQMILYVGMHLSTFFVL